MDTFVKYIATGVISATVVAVIFVLNRKRPRVATPERFRALLFADQALEDLVSNPTTSSARHPAWATFGNARALVSAGRIEEARAQLKVLLEETTLPTRIQLWAWGALRSIGEQPPDSAAHAAQGAVIEIPQPFGVDTFAVYSGGAVRYVSAGGQIVTRDTPDDATRAQADEILQFLTSVTPSMIETSEHPEPGTDKVYVTVLTFSGTRYASAPLRELQERKHPFSKVYFTSAEIIERLAREG